MVVGGFIPFQGRLVQESLSSAAPLHWREGVPALNWGDGGVGLKRKSQRDSGLLLKKGMATHSSILAWRIPMDRGTWQATVYAVAKSQTQLSN